MSSSRTSTQIVHALEPYGGTSDAAWRVIDWDRYEHTRLVAGRLLRFVDIGSGEIPVLLIHGHGSTWQYWLEVISVLVHDGRRVIALDLPGFGASQPHAFRSASMDSMVSAITELLDQLDVERYNIVGHSFGTIVGIELAVTDERINTLTLAGGPALSIVRLFQQPIRTALRYPRLALTAAGDMCTAGLPIPRWLQSLFARYDWLRRLAFGSYVAQPAALAPDLAKILMAGVGAPAYFHLPVKARTFTPAPAGDVRCPVLLVNGDHDAFVPAADIEEFISQVPQTRAVTITGAGHLVTVEYPATFVQLHREFLQSVAYRDTAAVTSS